MNVKFIVMLPVRDMSGSKRALSRVDHERFQSLVVIQFWQDIASQADFTLHCISLENNVRDTGTYHFTVNIHHGGEGLKEQ